MKTYRVPKLQTILMMTFAFALLLMGAVLATSSFAADEPAGHAAAIELGKTRFGEKCGGFCHGAGGKGGRAPCLICGKFKYGESDEAIAKNIAEGIAGTPMGSFGDKLNKEEIQGIVAFLRDKQKAKAAEGQ